MVTPLEMAKYIYKANVTVILKIRNSSTYFYVNGWRLATADQNSARGVLCGQRCSGVSAVSSAWNMQEAIGKTGLLRGERESGQKAGVYVAHGVMRGGRPWR